VCEISQAAYIEAIIFLKTMPFLVSQAFTSLHFCLYKLHQHGCYEIFNTFYELIKGEMLEYAEPILF
jgi:hypothetical protein